MIVKITFDPPTHRNPVPPTKKAQTRAQLNKTMIESLKKSLEAHPDNPFLQGHVEALTAAIESRNARRSAAACSACGKFPKLEKTARPDAMQLSHLCGDARDHDFGEFGEESVLISLWNNQQNASAMASADEKTTPKEKTL